MNGPDRALDETRSLVVPALRKAVDRLDPQLRKVVAYHLGWVDEHGDPTVEDGGKAVRPTLALAGARAVGADPSAVVAGAVAVELVHNFSLVHDDIMDRDVTRRHRPTVWSIWGEPTAILAGDAMASLAREVVLEDTGTGAPRAALMLERATRTLIHGQVQDMEFEERGTVPLAECEAMSTRKTSSLLAASTVIGALLADADRDLVRPLWSYGIHVGLAFQLIDDVLGIWGDPKVTGKSNHSDLRAKKKSLPMTWALEQGSADADRLRAWLTTGGTTESEIASAVDALDRLRAKDWAEHRAADLVDAAKNDLDGTALVRDAVDELCELADFICARKA
ncbi:polyprenyl synthetase family protein [Leekyejoonella antrihumi]|uniref:Polyprenyl synthetase family protein n=1 Tax=Leekyejoonella antrihumi TaxID=1660198 RepID=A0A563E5W1_9MICO|nr:polyprenyl synthetase family protein [Leekyejoonella antrihumi]TWP37679.1 polyprenyl synthetase family protein [Leekyejoonella antrihumi]